MKQMGKDEKQKEDLTMENLKQAWNGYSKGCYWFIYLRCFKENWEIVKKMLLPCPGGIVLDAGCGAGGLFKEILEKMKPKEVVAVDWSEKMLEGATKRLEKFDKTQREKFKLLKVDLLKSFPWPDQTFNACVFNLVLNYLPRDGWKQAVKESFRIIKPGGYIYISVMLKGWDLPDMIKKEMPKEFISNPINCIRAAKVKKYSKIIQEYEKKGIIDYPNLEEFIDYLRSIGFREIEKDYIFWETGAIMRGQK